MYYFIKWVEIGHKCNKLTNSIAWVPEMTLFLFWWTAHTCIPEETVCHCPVACCVTASFALPNLTGTGKDGINHYCHLPYTRNQRDRATGNELRLGSFLQDGSLVCCFVKFLRRICFALATWSHWYCPDDSYVNTKCPHNQAWVRHSMSGSWNHISAWNITFQVVAHFEVNIGDQFLSVEFWHVNNGGLYTSHLVNLLLRCKVTEAWYTDCVFENHRQKIF